jgi:endonuclease/exonuclease/phosphatase (EEP) superfamily protein YafD
MMIPKSILLSLLIGCILLGCASVPEQEQLVSVKKDSRLTRSNGDCSQAELNDRQTDISRTGLTPASISIFDWNMHKGQDQNWALDFSSLSHGKDIIFLQEVSLTEKMKQVLHETSMCWNMNSAFRYKGLETGVLLASKIQPLCSCGLRQREPLIRVPKTILINRYKIADSTQVLLVANIHGINISLGTGSYQEQFNELMDFLERHRGPIILAGDFNNWTRQRTSIMESLTKNLSLKALAFNDEGRTTFFGDPVDHIFYRGLEVVTHAVHPVTSSDHNPISATFRIAQTKQKSS